jgi:apolipoprotein N-acyltransferase
MFLVPSLPTPVSVMGTAAAVHPRRRRLIGPVSEGQDVDRGLRSSLAWIVGVAVLGTAWLFPETGWSAGLGWVAALLIAYALRSGRAYAAAYAAGLIGHIIGFHWVYRTVAVFGGFGTPAVALIFMLFVGLGALQFLAIAVIAHHLDRAFDALALRSAAAVVLAELLTPRLFPWNFGHTQIAFTPFVQVAAVGGTMAVSFLMFWLAEVVVRVVAFRERRWAFLIPVAAFGLAVAYGLAMMDRFGSPRGERQEVVVAQGHVAGAERRDLQLAREYLARLFDLSRRAAHPGSLVIWPEGAIPAYLPATMGTVGDPPALPWTGDGSAYLVGAYAFLPSEEKFNAAFAVHADGEVPLPYFKQVLIPFGEYMPLASYIPWLRTLNAKAGVFGAGTETKVFAYPMRRPDGSEYLLKVSPLVCYEDTVPSLSREATRKGAELLVNLTSDAWFGRSLAPHQHHLIAAFRAIENRRYLVRSTTTGLSAVVDPLGRTIARIPPFSEGTITATVSLLKDATPYTAWVGDWPWWLLLATGAGLAIVRRARAGGLWPGIPHRTRPVTI